MNGSSSGETKIILQQDVADRQSERLARITSSLNFQPNQDHRNFLRMQNEMQHVLPNIARTIAESSLDASDLPEYIAGVNTIYTALYSDRYGVFSNIQSLIEACPTLNDMRQLQTLLIEYQQEFPSGHFKTDMGTLLPLIFEKSSSSEERQALYRTSTRLYKAREPQISAEEQSLLARRQELETEFNATDPQEMVEVDELDLTSGLPTGSKISIPKRNIIQSKLDLFPSAEYTYMHVTNLLRFAPSLDYFLDASQTMLSIREIIEEFPYQMTITYMGSRKHGIFKYDRAAFQRINANILAYIALPDSLVHVLLHAQNIFNTQRTGNGIGDFVIEALQAEVTPLNLHRLLEELIHVPGTSAERFEQNRQDAIAIEGIGLSNLKEMIHDQVKGIHTLVDAVISYAKTQDPIAKKVIEDFMDIYHELRADAPVLFEISTYTRTTSTGESALDVLTRLSKNTAAASHQEKPPVTGVTSLDEALNTAESGSEVDITTALHAMNEYLLKIQGKHQEGLEPNVIIAIAWLDHQSFMFMQNLAKAEKTADNLGKLRQAYKQPWYAEAVKLSLLTSSTIPVPAEELDAFTTTLADEPTPNESARVLRERLVPQMEALAARYRAEGKTDVNIGNLWSGNTIDGLNMLGESYPPNEEAWESLTRLARGKETLKAIHTQETEAKATLQTTLDSLSARPDGQITHDITQGNDAMVDNMYQRYQNLRAETLEHAIGNIMQNYKNEWQIGSILRALGLESRYIRYGDDMTPLLYLSGNIYGNRIEAVLYDTAIPMGQARVNGETISNRDDLIRALHLPAVYRSLSREGD